MNATLKQLLNRKSVRNFTGENVKNEDLKFIFEAAQRCPNSINGQQVSLVYTRDKNKIKQISKLCSNQKQVEIADVFVTIVIDFNRTSYAIESLGKKQVIEKSAEGIIVGTLDAGIMLSSLQTAAESLGYGTTAIGDVRCAPYEFIEILKLPSKTYPIVGTTIGVVKQNVIASPLKPRVPIDSFVFEDFYDDIKIKEGVEQYEYDLKNFRVNNEMDYMTSYKGTVCSFYEKYYMPEVKKSFEKQGFRFEDKEI
ncbi:nitroreductase family protein [Arcobacter sp. L]|uniref:nitroreductase family protein n=1 Tax=Arcobacter sp. L TaxID=944547 RepID=UPI0002295FEB|nr:nitroreductase family protein [Arcobacter sp. L]BAK72845.1 nitroreductase [Arcobacter sp. L]